MNGDGQPDRFVVPANSLNKAAAAEAGEERERTKGNAGSETRPGRSAIAASSGPCGMLSAGRQPDAAEVSEYDCRSGCRHQRRADLALAWLGAPSWSAAWC
jgi:hypothetical protein